MWLARLAELSAGAVAREEDPESGDSEPDLTAKEDPDPPEGCWNCEAGTHRAGECPHEPIGTFCFRCGTQGYTVRTCPHCQADWLAQGPYIKEQGHEGPDPPRDRRARRDRRREPY